MSDSERKDADDFNGKIRKYDAEKCVKEKKKCKVAGRDDTPYEMYKNGGAIILDRMTELFNQVWEVERVPK